MILETISMVFCFPSTLKNTKKSVANFLWDYCVFWRPESVDQHFGPKIPLKWISTTHSRLQLPLHPWQSVLEVIFGSLKHVLWDMQLKYCEKANFRGNFWPKSWSTDSGLQNTQKPGKKLATLLFVFFNVGGKQKTIGIVSNIMIERDCKIGQIPLHY